MSAPDVDWDGTVNEDGKRVFVIPVIYFTVGVILAWFTVVGGLSVMTGATNPPESSDTVVQYTAD